MATKTRSREVIIIGILFLGLILGLTGLTDSSEIAATEKKPDNEPNKPAVVQSKPNCVLCGFITDSKTGQPVTDATVIIEHNYKTETDANGFYCLEKIYQDGDYRIQIDTNEYIGITDYSATSTVNLRKDTRTTKDFKLDKACMIEIQVVDEAGKPIEGAELRAISLADQFGREIDNGRRRTDKKGTVIYGGLPPSKISYLIIASHSVQTNIIQENGARCSQVVEDYAQGKLTVILNDVEVVETGRIVLQKGIDVSGYARYEDDVPASDLRIIAYPDWWQGNYSPGQYDVDANGLFTLHHIVPGIYRLEVLIPTGLGSSTGINAMQTRLPLPSGELLTVKIPQNSPQSLASIRGKMIFAGDKVPNSVNIDAYSPNNTSRMSHSTFWQNYRRDACDTNFVIDRLEKGKYRLTFSSPDLETKTIEDVNAPADGLVVELAALSKLYLKGSVLNSQTNQPIRKFRARINKVIGSRYMRTEQWYEFNDAEGKFNIETNGAGIYRVQAAADGFAWAWSQDVNTEQNLPIVITLAAGGGIKGKVVDDKGKPVGGVKVIPLSKAGGSGLYDKELFVSQDGAVETTNGEFLLNNLPPGKETLKAIHPDYAPSIVKNIDVSEGKTTEGIEIVLGKGATVEGYVYDAEGKLQPGAVLTFNATRDYDFSKANQIAQATTDANGYYRVDGLPEQTCYVSRQKEWDVLGVTKRLIIPKNGDTARLDFGGRPVVSGTIVLEGQSAANLKISLYAGDNQYSDVFTCRVLTDSKGGFKFAGVPLGRHTIFYESPDKQNNQVKLTSFYVGSEDLNLGTVPQRYTGKVLVSLEQEANEPKWEIAQIYLLEGTEKSHRGTNFARKPAGPGQPYVFSNIAAGNYTIVASRADWLNIRQEITASEKETSVSLKIPPCASSISGKILGVQKSGIFIWQKDQKITGYIRPQQNGSYKLENLPAGRYSIGGNYWINPDESLLEIELAQGEQKIVDIDASKLPGNTTATLNVQVVDNHGIPIFGADVKLEGDSGTIEPYGNSGEGEYFVGKPGSYVLYASYPGFKKTQQKVTLEPIVEGVAVNKLPAVVVRLEKQ